MTTKNDDGNALTAALRQRLGDLTTLTERLARHAAGPASPLLLARLLVTADKVAATLQRHLVALQAATGGVT
jgi:hypothetical protein